MSAPRLSIVTVVRNDIAGLRKTVDSVLAQSFRDWELIIKDGQSRDGTGALAYQFASRHGRITAISGPDDDLYDAMNIGLDCAVGEYVLFLNAGDWLADTERLDRAFAHLEGFPSGPDIAFFDTSLTYPQGLKRLRKARKPASIRYGQPAIHQSTLVRTAWQKRFTFDAADYPIVADYVSVARMMRSGAVACSFSERLATFSMETNSTSYRNQTEAAREFARAIDVLWKPPPWEAACNHIRRLAAMHATRLLMCG